MIGEYSFFFRLAICVFYLFTHLTRLWWLITYRDNDLAPLNNNAVAGNSKSKSKNIAKLADITLADHSLDFGLYNDDNQNDGAYGFDFGPEGALGDEYELDLGFEDELDLGFGVEGETSVKGKGKKRARDNGDGLSEVEGEDDEDRSVEAGRDAAGSQAHASARGSSLPPRIDEDGDMIMGEKDEEMGAFDDMGMDFGDYGGGGKEDQFDLEGQREKSEFIRFIRFLLRILCLTFSFSFQLHKRMPISPNHMVLHLRLQQI